MNKRLKALSCALVAIFALSIAVDSPKTGLFGVDAVSAATGVAPVTPAKPTKPSKPSTSTNQNTSPAYNTSTGVTRLLRFNSMGNDVKALQTTLNLKGYKLTVDGILGNLTLAAVKNYQGKNALAVDGLVGPATFAKLNAKPVAPKPPVVKPPVVVPPVVTPPVVVPPVVTPPDTVTSASLVDNAAVFEKSIGKDGKWIVTTTKDLTSTKELVLEGDFKNGKKDTVTGADLIQRKIGLYTQDDKRAITARFTLTAPKLTIKSPMSSLEYGIFKGDLYVTSADFKLIDATVVGNVYVSATNFTMTKNANIQGNIYFSTQGAKDTFKPEATTSVTGTKDLIKVDTVTTASIVNDATAFEKAISKDGKWIAASLSDITTTKELVLEGKISNGKKDAAGVDIIQREIALYTSAKQDGKSVVTNKFTLTAPKLTIKSPEANIQSSIFKGKLYVSSRNFKLTDSKVIGDVYVHSTEFKLAGNSKIEGNVYFDNIEAQKTFIIEAGSTVTGTQTLSQAPSMVDSISSASLVDNDKFSFENAIGKTGTWIICPVKDLVINKDLVLEGDLTKLDTKAVPPVQVPTGRKIGLYYHDGDNYTTARFTLTAPKLTIKSKDSNISKGIFKGDLYVSATGFKLVDARIEGNVYFTTQAAKDTFKMDATSSVTGNKELIDVDAVTSASLVNDVAAFENAISTKGNWIASVSKDLTTTKELVLDGDKMNTKTPPVSMRKIALYSQDDKYAVTRRFTLTAPKLTIKSIDASIQKGIFVGDIYVSAKNFQLIDTKVIGNVYFTTAEAQTTFKMDATSSLTGIQMLKLN
ncbi:peptidoglycan-binding protein [Clostridium estertheticum]|uniref:peptidoglycan-binding domain-containing protein n=1 Tax=Clostridium estertheticum TaxID=238834 RepID=UPI0013E93D4D|nr:peptidoglycan-binding protein [Clostridium estertheticum]MBZ9684959.1 peptidoglycan-binding protein [Clostridium estertheticum]